MPKLFWILSIAIMTLLNTSCKNNCDNTSCLNSSSPNDDCICICLSGYIGENCESSFGDQLKGLYEGSKQCISNGTDTLAVEPVVLNITKVNESTVLVEEWNVQLLIQENSVEIPLQSSINLQGETYQISGLGSYMNGNLLMQTAVDFDNSSANLSCNYDIKL